MRDEDLPVDPDATESFVAPADGRPVPRWDIALAVALGGALGALARYGVNAALPHDAAGFPWATLVENVSGCFLLGAVVVFLVDVWPSHGAWRIARPFLAVGVLGGFTTFSTYAVDIRTLTVSSNAGVALLYLVGTLVGGLVATWLGLALGRRVAGIPQRTLRPGRSS